MKFFYSISFIIALLLCFIVQSNAQQKLDAGNYITVDNSPNSPTSAAGSPGTTTVSVEYNEVGPWWTGATTSGWGGGYRQTSQLGGEIIAGRSATWTMTVPDGKPGYYIVYNYVLQAANNASNVYYTIQNEFSSVIQDSVRHDLRRSSITSASVAIGAWVPLMIDNLNVGNYKITVGADSLSGSGIMRADAVRILRSTTVGADLEFARRSRDGFDSVRVGENWLDAPLGTITYKQLPLFNLGSLPLQINSVHTSFLPNRWDLRLPNNATFPLIIPPGGKASLVVGFRPFQEETVIDTLIIESNDSAEVKATIPISGNGINYNFILNSSIINEPNYNAPFDKLADPKRPQIIRQGVWAASQTGISSFPYPIAGGNLQGTFSFDAVCGTEYRFQLPDSVNGVPGSSGNYFIEHGAIPFTSNSENNAQVTIIPPFSTDTVRTVYNQSGLTTPPFFYPFANKPIFLTQGDWISVKIYRTIATQAVLRADLIRIRKIPTGATIAASPQLNFGNVSIYPAERNLANNYKLNLEINSGGETALRIDSIVIANNQFYSFVNLPATPFLLAAVNGSQKIAVAFTPDAIASLNTTIRVYSNDTTKNPYVIPVTGAGIGTGQVLEEDNVQSSFVFPQNPVTFPDLVNITKWQKSTASGSGGSSMLGYIYHLQGDASMPNKASYVEYFPSLPILDGGGPALDTFNVYARVPVGSSNSTPRAIYKIFQGAGGSVIIDTINQNGRGTDRVFLGTALFLRSNGRDSHGSGAINGYIRLENDTNLVSAYYKDSLINRARQDSFIVRADAIILQEAILTGVEHEVLPSIPNDYSLSQNYPNPFNPSTTIRFGLPMSENVQLKIYDILGREIRSLVNERFDAGAYTIQWDGKNSNGRNVATGMYIYQIRAGQFVQTKKMLLMK